MRCLSIIALSLSCIIGLTSSLAGQALQSDEATREVSEPLIAEAAVMIVGNPLELGDRSDTAREPNQTISWLLASWSPEGVNPEDEQEFHVSFHMLPGAPEGSTIGTLRVRGSGETEEMLTWGQKRLEEVLREVYRKLRSEPLMEELNVVAKRRRQVEQRVMELADQLRNLQQAAREQGIALEPDDPQLLASVKRDNLALRAELAGLSAQYDAINVQIAIANDKLSEGKADEDLIRNELVNVMKLRQEELARMAQLAESGHVSEHDVMQAQVALAKAEADLAEYRRNLAQQADSGPLGRLNERLVETKIAITTAEARLKETYKAIEQLEESSHNPAHPLIMEVQQAQREMDSAWTELQAASAEQARLRMVLEALPSPKVILIRKQTDPQ